MTENNTTAASKKRKHKTIPFRNHATHISKNQPQPGLDSVLNEALTGMKTAHDEHRIALRWHRSQMSEGMKIVWMNIAKDNRQNYRRWKDVYREEKVMLRTELAEKQLDAK